MKSNAVAATTLLTVLTACLLGAQQADAQEVRYSWMDLSFAAQDIDEMGSQIPVVGQTVDVDAGDGDGVRFRASVGTWNNFYLFFDYRSADVDVDAVVTNNQGVFPASDEFDYTAARGGLGYRIPLRFDTDVYAEVSFDSVDFDFGSFAGENFDLDSQDVGASIGVRKMFGDRLELRAYGRFTAAGDVELSMLELDNDTLFGAGFGFDIVRGFSIVGDYEAGEFSGWSLGFRLDLDED